MIVPITSVSPRRIVHGNILRWTLSIVCLNTLFLVFPSLALAQSGSPFDSGFNSLQNLFTGTIAKVASLIAIVIGGYMFAHGEPGAKKPPAPRRASFGRGGGLCRALAP